MKSYSKTIGATAGGMIATLIVGTMKMNGIVLDPDMATALGGLCAIIGAYFSPQNAA